ncbi:hypothetical protein ACQ5SP_08300 [Rhodovulum sp. YNF3179]|uniref:hypothetical protein n=1 Tax=Rhodovulum sp. YNF3179 TaxID=3425127 RepID=UPI003D337327
MKQLMKPAFGAAPTGPWRGVSKRVEPEAAMASARRTHAVQSRIDGAPRIDPEA